MDRITDSGSVGCGSIPHGATFYPPVAEATAPRGMPTSFACRVRFSPFRISLRKIPGPLTRLVTPRQARNPPVAGATAPKGMPTRFACRVRFSPFRISLRNIPGPLTRLVTLRLSGRGYLHQWSSHRKYSRCQRRAFCGLRIQWFSSGKISSRDGTPII